MPRKTKLTANDLPLNLLEPLKNVSKKHKFECPFCKSEFFTTPTKVHSGHTKSCGCTRIGKRTGSKYFSGNFLDRCKKGAKARNIKWSVTNEELDYIMESQLFKCNLSKQELRYGYIPINEYTASIDRIDSKKHYTKDNIQILNKDVNLGKQSLSQNEFIKLCKEVAKWN
jgi:hypothetical protein